MVDSDWTMRCPSCSADVPPWEPVCPGCGFALDGDSLEQHETKDICRKCGASLREGMIRCRDCGQLVHDDEPVHDNKPAVKGKRAKRRGRKPSNGSPAEVAADRMPQSPVPSASRPDGTAVRGSQGVATESTAAQDGATATASVAGIAAEMEDAATTQKAPALSFGINRRMLRRAALLASVVAVFGGLFAAWQMFGDERRPPEFLKALPSAAGPLTTVLFDPEGKRLVAGSASGVVTVWDLASEKPTLLPQLTDKPIIRLAIAPDGFLTGADEDGNVVGFNFDGSQAAVIREMAAPVTAIVFRYSKATEVEIILGLADGDLVFINPKGKGKRKSQHLRGIRSALYLTDRDILITGGTDGQLIWMKAETRIVSTMKQAHQTEVSALSLSADAKVVASGDWNGEIVFWNVDTEQENARCSQPDAVSGMAFIGGRLVTGSWDGILRIWSVEQQSVVHEIDTGRAIYGLAVTPDGLTIATVSERPQVELWKVPVD